MIHSELVNRVVEMLLDGDDEVLSQLKRQYNSAKIISEEVGNVGFYIDFYIKDYEIKKEFFNNTFQIGDVDGIVEGVEGAIGFVLYIKDGFITMLEGYTNVIDKWPVMDSQIELKYDTGNERDYNALERVWRRDA